MREKNAQAHYMNISYENPLTLSTIPFAFLLLGAALLGAISVPLAVHSATRPTVGVLVPLYSYPTGGTWTQLIDLKEAQAVVPMIAIVNPSSGPGSSKDPNYAQGIKDLQAAGIRVVGYDPTDWAAKPLSTVEYEASLYKQWYGVNGIFFDQMSNKDLAYYQALAGDISSLGMGLTIGNSGGRVPLSYLGVLSMYNIYELGGYPSVTRLTYGGQNPNYFASTPYDVALNDTYLASLVGINGWVYCTDLTLPNPYATLPTYMAGEVAELAVLDGVTATVTVDSFNLSGSPIHGLWTTSWQNGRLVATGFTSHQFTGNIGDAYTVRMGNYQNYVFCHWGDGKTSPSRTFTLEKDTGVFSAYYSTTGSCPIS